MKQIGEIKALPDSSNEINTSEANTRRYSVAGTECPICGGAGFYRLDVPLSHPLFGKAIDCDCRRSAAAARRSQDYGELSGLGVLEDWTFEGFDANVPGVRRAYEICLAYAQNPDGWLLLTGSFGCGKTHLAAAIANYVAQSQVTFPLFTVVPDLLDYLRAAFAPEQGLSYDNRFNEIRNASLLVLDDLGTENSTPWATEKLFQIINYRYNQRRPTIITTNRDLDRMDPRIASRIKDSAICTHLYIDAKDYRERRARVTRPR
ncbi:MAG TPA: ATP-binding protein [Nitrolancea sp.]|jgi:DNA replication protein DnaC|nr:ATP-binding protein [Nitrolancea sp.]